MKTSIDHVIHAAIRKPADEINLVYIPYDGHFEHIMSTVPMKLYAPHNSLVHEWPCGQWPDNLNWLPSGVGRLPNRIDIDAVFVNWRKDQATAADKIANQFHIPLIIVDHELPNPSSNDNLRRYVNSRMPQNAIYISPHNVVREQWLYNEGMEVHDIPYGFHVSDAVQKTNDVLVVGDYNAQDVGLVKEMMSCHNEVIGLGYNEGTKEYSTINEIIQAMLISKVCLTASQPQKPPFLAMLAAACGCAVVTNKTEWNEGVFEHEKDSMIFKSTVDIKQFVKHLTQGNNHEEISLSARQLINDNYNIDQFKKAWLELIHRLSTRVYIR